MNALRRKRIAEAAVNLRAILADVETLRDEEQDYYDNMPESIQAGEKGSTAEEAAQSLGEVCDNIEEAASGLENLGS